MNAKQKLESLLAGEFHRWFNDAVFSENGIEVPSRFKADWIENKFTRELIVAFEKQPKITVKENKEVPKPVKAPALAKVIQLPLWPEPARGTPNSFLRSSLFAAIQGKTRRYMKKELLGSLKGYTVRFTGMQLDQSDLDVWEHAVHLSRMHPLGNECVFKANAFLKGIGRSNGKANYKWLDDAITRLVACAVEIRCGTKVFTGSLLHTCIRDECTGLYKLRLDPETVKLYGSTDWTALEWAQRAALSRKPLALWLHGFYATHATPHPMKMETLRELSGSSNKEIRDFKRKLKAALNDLEKVTGWNCYFEADLVVIEKPPRLPSMY